MDWHGKVALVTGGGTGVGRATALRLAARGAAVAVNYSRSEAEAEEVAALIRTQGGRALALRADVSDDAQVRLLVRWIQQAWGRLDLLVNNAACTRFLDHRDLEAHTDEVWDRILAVNLKGAFYCARAAAPLLREHGDGAIVNVASVAGLTGGGSSIAYAASKAALLTMTRSLARALAPEVRVNAVAPGFLVTRWTEGQDRRRDEAIARSALRRLAEPEDVADAILYLASARAVTGQTLVVDAGRSLD